MRTLSSLLALALLAGCSKPKEAEKEVVAPVQVSEAKRDSIQRIIAADGILFPLDQAVYWVLSHKRILSARLI